MDKWVVYILLAVCLSSCGQASGNKQVKQGTDSLQNDTVVSHSVDSLAYAYGEFYQFNLSSCIRQQNSLTAQFVSFSLSNLANIFYPPQFLQ